MHDAPAVGKACDHDVEEAADDEAKEEARRLEEQGREHGVIVQERRSGARQDRGTASATREGRGPLPRPAGNEWMGGYGTVMVVPSPVAVMENVPAVLDA